MSWAQVQDDVRITALGALDRGYMDRQRASMDELARRHLGRSFRGDPKTDLDLMQRLLDGGWVGSDDRESLQALGILLGDLLAAQLGMEWVIYTDRTGRSRALRHRDTPEALFPVTMISRRYEAGDRAPVAEIYGRAVADMRALLPRPPYQ